MSDYIDSVLLGSDLKDLFPGEYYARSHKLSCPLNLLICDFLTLSGIRDDVQYSVSYNDDFCKVSFMNEKKSFLFFHHVPRPSADFWFSDFPDAEIPDCCPVCGSPLRFRSGPYSPFVSCLNRDCSYHIRLRVIGFPVAKVPDKKV